MKVGIVGTGMVGATAAYALVMRGVGREIVLVDKNEQRASAEADDLFHAVPFSHALTIASGNYSRLEGASVILLCAGVGQKPGESRLELLQRNAAIFAELVPNVLRYAPDAVLVVATNPVDVMTHITAHFAKKVRGNAARVFGSGTTLDTARFRTLLGQHLQVDPHHVHAYVVGEHGDSEVLTWSRATVAGLPVDVFAESRGLKLTDEDRQSIDRQVRRAAYHIIEGKGATYYGIGSALARITQAVLHDQRAVLTVCSPTDMIADTPGVTMALPSIVGGAGVLSIIPPLLDNEEEAALRRSAGILAQAIGELRL